MLPAVSATVGRNGDFIRRSKQFLVLCLEGRVEGKETRTFVIPVREVGQRHERVRIRQDLIEALSERAW